jgi:hypothetical protein
VSDLVGYAAAVRAIADPLIEQGATPEQVRQAILDQLDIGIGAGGAGPYDIPPCPYCGARGGGGHGGLCPRGLEPGR